MTSFSCNKGNTISYIRVSSRNFRFGISLAETRHTFEVAVSGIVGSSNKHDINVNGELLSATGAFASKHLGSGLTKKHCCGKIWDFLRFTKRFSLCPPSKHCCRNKKVPFRDFRNIFCFSTSICLSEKFFLRLSTRKTMLPSCATVRRILRLYTNLRHSWMFLTKRYPIYPINDIKVEYCVDSVTK